MKFQSIQFLRAVAALMVVVYHSHIAFSPEEKALLWWWPGVSDLGWFGVDLFFAISGFIIAHVLSSRDFQIGAFVWRRLCRIAPLYWTVMLAGLYYYQQRGWFAADVTAAGAAGMVKSFLILPQEPHPFWSPGWSLEHEVLFYVIAAVAAPFIGLRWLAVVLIAFGVAGSILPVGWSYHLLDQAQILFGAGIVAYLLQKRSWRGASVASLAGFTLAYAHHYGLMILPGILPTVAFAIGSGALMVTLLNFEREGWRVPKSMVLIGNASFSLYLWHWLMIPFVSRWNDIGGHPELWRWFIVAVSVAVALASYQLIEKPFIYLSHRRWRTPKPQPAE